MAFTPLNLSLTAGGATYTVPANKLAIISASPGTANSVTTLEIDVGSGPVPIATLPGTGTAQSGYGGLRKHPICANAGDVISAVGGGTIGLSGFLFDTDVSFIAFSAQVVAAGATYTVPTGKIAIFALFADSSGSVSTLAVGGVNVGSLIGTSAVNNYGGPSRSPITAAAGDVVSCSGGSAVGISGLLIPA